MPQNSIDFHCFCKGTPEAALSSILPFLKGFDSKKYAVRWRKFLANGARGASRASEGISFFCFFVFFLPSVACLGLLNRQTTCELPQPVQCLPGMWFSHGLLDSE